MPSTANEEAIRRTSRILEEEFNGVETELKSLTEHMTVVAENMHAPGFEDAAKTFQNVVRMARAAKDAISEFKVGTNRFADQVAEIKDFKFDFGR
jgi:hypothetical protein